LGEDMWLFASDWPHGDSAWPESVQQTADRPRLTESARKKILGENAMRLCPRLRG
jgi:predicted TIM-barrel fold metal-dependent hydrolase